VRAAPGFPHRVGAHPLEPVPVLLVLEPTTGGWPWSAATRWAATTLQSRGLAHHLDDPSVGASLAYAIERQGVEAIVLAVEGTDRAQVEAILSRTAAPLAAWLRAHAGPERRPPSLHALWLDPSRTGLEVLDLAPAHPGDVARPPALLQLLAVLGLSAGA
jgi:hypothetical protein